MEVIFIKDLKNQGKKGEIKTVKDGYAENFLIKKGYAVMKTKESLARLQSEQRSKAKEDAENKKVAEAMKKDLDKLVIEFKVKTGEGDKVFGSISVKQVKDELQKNNFKIDKSQIEILSPIASLGFHNVDIKLYPGITATIKVHVVK
ncbi:MAG: 50S ribosomal protein L9 [Mycoplasmatota bacterium]|nr:50S ribosomal protein L9 [Mycoplasmatota bacterium]